MKIYRMLKTNQINQGYGRAKTVPSLIPLYESYGLLGHDGIDFGVVCKDFTVMHGGGCEPIYYSCDGYGTAVYIQKDDTNGWGVNILDQDGIHKTCYWHLDTIDVIVGQRVEGGTRIGLSGRTGVGTGCHLHFGLYEYGQEGNGYKGAIDPTPYYVPIFVNDFIDSLAAKISLLQKLINLLTGKK